MFQLHQWQIFWNMWLMLCIRVCGVSIFFRRWKSLSKILRRRLKIHPRQQFTQRFRLGYPLKVLQSQFFSFYKSHNTLKDPVGCDPTESINFISEFFTGSTDKVICEKSELFYLLQSKVQQMNIWGGQCNGR